MTRRAILLEALAATPRDLGRMARRVEPAAALARPDPAGWCVADVVAHMAMAEPLYLAIFRRAAAEERPVEALSPRASLGVTWHCNAIQCQLRNS
jgi:uncharacterized damage-inducible protein DinB